MTSKLRIIETTRRMGTVVTEGRASSTPSGHLFARITRALRCEGAKGSTPCMAVHLEGGMPATLPGRLRSIWQARSDYAYASPRHTAYLTAFQALWTTLRGTVWGARAADPAGWRSVEVKEPVFVFANARSGTTFFHNVLAQDTTRFAGLRLLESVFPSLHLQRGLERAGAHLAPNPKVLAAVESKLFGRWQGIHDMSLTGYEEDEAFFAYALATPALLFLVPHFEALKSFCWLDGQSAALRHQLMDEYEASLQRHLFLHQSHAGGEPATPKQYLNKNVLLSSRLETTATRFPDARFIYLVRDPRKSIPSFISLFEAVWRAHSPSLSAIGPETRALAELAAAQYRYALEVGDTLGDDRFAIVRFDELIRDPLRQVDQVYERFGWKLGDVARRRMASEIARASQYRSKHHYTLEGYGLDEKWVQSELGSVLDRFAFQAAGRESATGH